MSRKISLPLTRWPTSSAAPPTVDVMRKRLGGRASTGEGAGEIVALVGDAGAERAGVVLFARGDELHVWVAEGIVRKTQRSLTRPVSAAVSQDLLAIADDARIFGDLREGERVRYHHDQGIGEGTMIEKCRFGALLLRDDGVVIGVGFRRVWPLGGDPGKDVN